MTPSPRDETRLVANARVEMRIPIPPDASEADLRAWTALTKGVAEATVARINQERGVVRWDGVEDQHVRRAAKIACDFLIGRRKLPAFEKDPHAEEEVRNER